MTNTNDTPITRSMMDDARARRLAHFAQPIIPNDRPARKVPPNARRTRRTSVRHRSIR